MTNSVLRKCGTLLVVCSTMLLAPSCRNETDLMPTQTPTEGQMDVMVEKVAKSPTYAALFSEMANMSVLVAKKQLIVKPIAVAELNNKLSSCRTVSEMEHNLAENFSNPSLVMRVTEKLNALLKQLDAETHFSTLSTEKRVELMKRVFGHSASKAAFVMAFKANGVQAQARFNDCGGNCNTAYWHALESAAANCALVALISWGAGVTGGPAGMMAGALGIAGAAAAYLIAEHYALISLGDCFENCM